MVAKILQIVLAYSIYTKVSLCIWILVMQPDVFAQLRNWIFLCHIATVLDKIM